MRCRGRRIAEVQDTGLVYIVSFRPGRVTQKDPESKKQKKKKIPKSKNYTLASIVLKAIPQIYFVNSRHGFSALQMYSYQEVFIFTFCQHTHSFWCASTLKQSLQKDTYLFTSGSLCFKLKTDCYWLNFDQYIFLPTKKLLLLEPTLSLLMCFSRGSCCALTLLYLMNSLKATSHESWRFCHSNSHVIHIICRSPLPINGDGTRENKEPNVDDTVKTGSKSCILKHHFQPLNQLKLKKNFLIRKIINKDYASIRSTVVSVCGNCLWGKEMYLYALVSSIT